MYICVSVDASVPVRVPVETTHKCHARTLHRHITSLRPTHCLPSGLDVSHIRAAVRLAQTGKRATAYKRSHSNNHESTSPSISAQSCSIARCRARALPHNCAQTSGIVRSYFISSGASNCLTLSMTYTPYQQSNPAIV